MVMLTVMAQANNPLSFKGVPIDGKLKDFCAKLKKEHCSFDGASGHTAMMRGEFAKYKDCDITILSSVTTDMVNRVGVDLPSSNSWDVLTNDYFTVKRMMNEVYGAPAFCEEKFSTTQPKDNKSIMLLVKNGLCSYRSEYTVQNGGIVLSISNRGKVRLVYMKNTY
jgi:hypothetical protein